MNFIKHIFVAILVVSLLTSCTSKKKDQDKVTPASELYSEGVSLLDKGDYKNASVEFEKIFFQHPGNDKTPLAELMQAYSLYKSGEHDEAVDILDIFIRLHPRHQYISYAYYLKALSYYSQISNIKLDQQKTRAAKASLQEVIERFPGSKYAIDSALKIDLANDHLAGHEMVVGRYYLKKKNPIAAIARFQTVVKEYETTSHIQEALYRMVECNLMFGLKDEARKYAAILKHNYPDNVWDQYSDQILK